MSDRAPEPLDAQWHPKGDHLRSLWAGQPDLAPEDIAALDYADQLTRDWAGDIVGEQRKPELYRFVRMVLDRDLLLEEVLSAADFFSFVNCRPPLPAAEVRELVQWAIEDHDKPSTKRDFGPIAAELAPAKRPEIRYEPRDLIAATDAALAAMLTDQASERLLSFSGYCTVRGVRLHHYDDPASLRERIMRSAEFLTYKQKAWARDICPDAIVQTLLARDGVGAPRFGGLLSAPTVRADGTIIDKAGFHEPTGLYATFRPGEFWTLPDKPDQAAAQAAYRWLVEKCFAEFPFASDVDAAVAVAALLTGLERRVCGLSPAFLFDSATRSTGKTTLAQLIGCIGGGVKPGPLDWSRSEDEMSKVIFSALREAAPALLFDNVQTATVIDSPSFAKLLTAGTFKGRVLGQSQMGELPTTALVMLTGTNLRLQGDAPTRVLSCRLDPRMERPDKRRFSREVFAWAESRRAEIVQAALTIIRAYQVAGSPETGGSGTRFPQWDQLVRRPIMWAAGVDVAAATDDAYDADDSVALLRDVHAAWDAALGRTETPAGRIFEIVVGATIGEHSKFADAMKALIGDRSSRGQQLTRQMIGTALKSVRDRVVDGRAITSRYDSHRKLHGWFVRATDSGKGEPNGIFS